MNGRKIELVVNDDQARPDQAVPLANKYVGDGLKIVVSGSYSGPTRASAGVFQGAKIPYISAYAIHPDITRAGNYGWAGVNSPHAFHNTSPNPVRWLETQSPQPARRHSIRHLDAWRQALSH